MTEKNLNFKEKLVYLNRVSKTLKGGRIFSFTALTVIGNEEGKIGFGYGKSKEVPNAIQKSIEKAYKNIVHININDKKTIIHESYGKFIKSIVFIKPANIGTGIIAGNSVRSILQLSGIKNILTKVHGSNNPINVVKATIIALTKIKKLDFIYKKRGINIK